MTLSTLLYSTKLGLTLSFTLLEIAWLKTPYSVRIFGVYTLVSILTTALVVSTVPAQSYTQITPHSPPPHQELLQQTTQNRTALEKKQELYQSLLQKQPQHRDLLINAALTAKALGNEADFQHYWLKAKSIDPNYPLFN